MPFCHVQWNSEVLAKAVNMNVLLPSVGKPPYPVFYLLHGQSDDYTMWHRRTRIEWYVQHLPLIVVMPDGFRGWYTNNDNGPAYATYMAEELPAFVERHFQARAERAARAIGGLSMGGYGAFRLALGYPDRYVSANSHSGALNAFPHFMEEPEKQLIFGREPLGSEHDLLVLAKRARAAGRLPALRIDCGSEDFLIEYNRAFHADLEALGVPHDYAEYPGVHSWDYWDEHIREALAFHAKALGIAAD